MTFKEKDCEMCNSRLRKDLREEFENMKRYIKNTRMKRHRSEVLPPYYLGVTRGMKDFIDRMEEILK